MTEPILHPTDALHELLDGRLDPRRRAEVESHLEACARCRRDAELLRASREAIRAADHAVSASNDVAFETRIRAVLDREDHTATVPRFLVPPRQRSVWLLLAAAVAIVAVFFASRWMLSPLSTPPADLVADAVGGLTAVRDGRLALDQVAEPPDALEAYFARSSIEFPVRVLDLGMMGWRVSGGRVHRIGDHPSALYLYRDQRGRLLACQMFAGRMGELPAGAEHFSHGEISFAVYERSGMTAVFWAEGNVLCVLVSDLPRDEVVGLATAKAMART